MDLTLKVLAGLFALLFIFMGVGFMLDPLGNAASLAVTPLGEHGLNTLRGDLGGLFLASAALILLGVFQRKGEWLVAVAVFMLFIAARPGDRLRGGRQSRRDHPGGVRIRDRHRRRAHPHRPPDGCRRRLNHGVVAPQGSRPTFSALARSLGPSLIGIGAFLVPVHHAGEQTILIGVVTGVLTGLLGPWLLQAVVAVTGLAALGGAVYLFLRPDWSERRPWLDAMCSVTPVWLVLRALGFAIGIMVLWEVGPEILWGEQDGRHRIPRHRYQQPRDPVRCLPAHAVSDRVRFHGVRRHPAAQTVPAPVPAARPFRHRCHGVLSLLRGGGPADHHRSVRARLLHGPGIRRGGRKLLRGFAAVQSADRAGVGHRASVFRLVSDHDRRLPSVCLPHGPAAAALPDAGRLFSGLDAGRTRGRLRRRAACSVRP